MTLLQLSIILLCSVLAVSLKSIWPDNGNSGIPTPSRVVRNKDSLKNSDCSVDFLDKMVDCSQRQLKDVPSDLILDLRSLDLTSNLIRRLRNASFVRYSLLEVLNLSNNLINIIDVGAFFPLERLTVLILDKNPIHILPKSDLFRESKRLSTLSMSSCNLTYFPNETLGLLPQIKVLILFDNELTYLNISKCPEGALTQINLRLNLLQELSAESLRLPCNTYSLLLCQTTYRKIDAAAIASLPIRSLSFELVLPGPGLTFEVWEQLFTGIALSEIDNLDLVNAVLVGDLPHDFFDPLRGKRLYLYMYNAWFKLYPSIFSSLTAVYKMKIYSLDIDVLQPSFFDGMSELHSLSLVATEMTQLNPSGARWNIDLTELDLSENNLVMLNNQAFWGLYNLAYLDLTYNPMLANFPSLPYVIGLQNLRTLIVSRTRISKMRLDTLFLENFLFTSRPYDWDRSASAFIPGQTFQYTPSLKFINLTSSFVVMRELWDSSRNISLFNGLNKLTYLGLKQNRLQRIPAGVFKDLSALKVLDLTDCQVSAIDSGSLDSLISLTVLFLQDNNLQILPMHVLDNLIHLNIFSIKDNALFYIDEYFFNSTPMITSLDLGRNQLSVFNKTTFSRISSTLSSIDLSQNPIECSCRSKWLIKLLRGIKEVQNVKQTTCSYVSEKPFGGEELVSIHPDDLCLKKFVISVPASFSILCVIIIIVITYHFRWSIKYKLFLLRLAVLGYEEILDENERDDYDFDIHVISTDDDFMWIQDHLKPTLQMILPYYERRRIVFTEDDLPIGRHRLEAIDDVLTRSFKVLVLMSKAAIADDWFLTCFRMAIDQGDDTQTENIVLVFLENIQEDEMPFLVRLYMGGQGPYLQWMEDDEEGQEYFRKKLFKYMSVNRKRNYLIPPE
ncbi:toll-like receptor 3 [Lytechinus pictus]|uniref:toll-like receptor 3 n=1 Tax=Lytechinus pictus TaxID=7653 RepID=UPI00240E7F43|nr:toll-like receptor 3 [Lytechinus pictus]